MARISRFKLRHLVVIACVWLLLFGASVGIASLVGSDRAGGSPKGHNDRESAELELATLPRKSAPPGEVLDGIDGLAYPELSASFDATVRSAKNKFLDCSEMSRTTRMRDIEYFEVSFDFAPVSQPAVRRFRMTKVDLERSTLGFDTDEVACMIRAFSELEFEASSAPKDRIFYRFCFSKQGNKGD